MESQDVKEEEITMKYFISGIVSYYMFSYNVRYISNLSYAQKYSKAFVGVGPFISVWSGVCIYILFTGWAVKPTSYYF